jgi:hypothetical protein
MQAFDRLDFDHKSSIHEQIKALVTEELPSITDRAHLLSLKGNRPLGQLNTSRSGVHALAHPGTELPMNSEQRADSLRDKRVDFGWERRDDS